LKAAATLAVVLGTLSIRTVYAENIASDKSGFMSSVVFGSKEYFLEYCTDGDYVDDSSNNVCIT